MSTFASQQDTTDKSPLVSNSPNELLLSQRKYAFGLPNSSLTSEYGDKTRLQAKLAIGASNDPLEQEADRVADQVMAAPAHSNVGNAPPRIQRFTDQPAGQTDMAPASVDRVLTSSGRPLEPALRQDMEQRSGYDFSRVRVHTGGAAEQSARDVSAHAYTVGHNIVFGVGRYAPETHEGRRLVAHELTHVAQQNNALRWASISPELENVLDGEKNKQLATAQRLQRQPAIVGLDEAGPKADLTGRKETELFNLAEREKKAAEAKQVYARLFEKPPSKETCKEWRDKSDKNYPKTTGEEMVDEFRDNLKKHLHKHPLAVAGDVKEKITEDDVDKISVVVNEAIITKFGSHVESPLSDADIKKRIQILPEKKTIESEFLKQWLANKIFMWTSVADYCVDEGDKRFQKTLDDILADSAMAEDLQVMASRQSAFIEGDDGGRTVYIHKGADEALAKSILTHEIVHFYANNDYRVWNAKMVAPRFVNEGFTEFLAREVMSEERKSYEERFAFIRDEVAKYVTVDDIAAAYFAGRVWQVENVSKVAKKLFKEFTETEKKKEKVK